MRWFMKVICFLLLLAGFNAIGQDDPFSEACVTDTEYELYLQINSYRNAHGLPSIPLSGSLCVVAGAHAWDLETNRPDRGPCNMHSWSDSGPWPGCCYTDDHREARCVWNKPGELTSYQGYGYEIAFFHSQPGNKSGSMAGLALEGWKGSSGHKNMILNRYSWKRLKWKAMGVGIYGRYAVVWFGEEADTAGKARRCD